jgi:hypothetical protein
MRRLQWLHRAGRAGLIEAIAGRLPACTCAAALVDANCQPPAIPTSPAICRALLFRCAGTATCRSSWLMWRPQT